MMRLWIFVLCGMAVWCGRGAAQETTFRKLEIEAPQFTAEKVGVLHLELEKVANLLVLFAYHEYAGKIREGDAQSRLLARRMLSLALHMDPGNVTVKRIHEMLVAQRTEKIEGVVVEGGTLALSASRLCNRLLMRSEPDAHRLAGFLGQIAADLDPQNEDAVYAAELFISKTPDLILAWKELAMGKIPAQAESPRKP